MTFEKRFFINIVKSSGGGANGGVWGGILGGGYNIKTKICKQHYWYLSE